MSYSNLRSVPVWELIIVFTVIALTHLSSHAQTKPRITIEDVYAEAKKPSYTNVRIENKTVVFPPNLNDSTITHLTRPLIFRNCEFEHNGFNFRLVAPYLRFENIKSNFFVFNQSKIDTLSISVLRGSGVFALGTSRIGEMDMYFDDVNDIGIDSATFLGNVSLRQDNFLGKTTILKITGCTFASPVRIEGEYSNFTLQRNTLSSSFVLENVNVSKWINISDNVFEDLFEVNALTIAIPESVKFRFSQIKGQKLTAFERRLVYEPSLGGYNPVPFKTNAVEYFSENIFNPGAATSDRNQIAFAGDSLYYHHPGFDDLLYNYQRLYNIYKIRGDLQSMNECYVEMKNVQTDYFRYIYKEEPSFNAFFRWRLAQLMRIYTEHGTDPAKAMTFSFWIVVVFGIFYIFFPSDWDVTSKSKLFSDFRMFIQKNEHGYLRPFFRLIGGLAISFINALTLSLNAFTTLGFGNIPTHGLARYVCVLQGFIGWFLLSIFTVALINQVLT